MPAHSNAYPWPPYYGHFDFFETRMRQHRRISTVKKVDDNTYELQVFPEPKLRVFICECYSFGIAEYAEVIGKIGKVDVIVINSNWCGYTLDAKRACRGDKVGLFSIGDLMAALNKPDITGYLNVSEEKTFKEKGWL